MPTPAQTAQNAPETAPDKRLTYLSPAEFRRLGERCFGYGWQRRLAEYLGYSRAQMIRYAGGADPIPVPIAVTLQALGAALDKGAPLYRPQPAGLIQDGAFIAAPQPEDIAA